MYLHVCVVLIISFAITGNARAIFVLFPISDRIMRGHKLCVVQCLATRTNTAVRSLTSDMNTRFAQFSLDTPNCAATTVRCGIESAGGYKAAITGTDGSIG